MGPTGCSKFIGNDDIVLLFNPFKKDSFNKIAFIISRSFTYEIASNVHHSLHRQRTKWLALSAGTGQIDNVTAGIIAWDAGTASRELEYYDTMSYAA